MKWQEFLNQLLDKKQIEILRCALKLKAPVHFYGIGLGKSTICDVLTALGYKASDPGYLNGGAAGPNGVPTNRGIVCFYVKKKAPEKLIPNLTENLKSQSEGILQWINACEV